MAAVDVEQGIMANTQFWGTDGCHDEHVVGGLALADKDTTDSCGFLGVVDRTFVSKFEQLLGLYSMHVNEQKIVSSGGFQQFLHKERLKRSNAEPPTPDSGETASLAPICSLPENVMLHIFSFLGTHDLCRISQVCTLWYDQSSDGWLWKRKLDRDLRQWNIIGHNTNPDIYRECMSDWTNKEIYLRCCPEVNQTLRQHSASFSNLSSMLKSLWSRKVPKLVMFGPGLESGTSGIVRDILHDKSESFTTYGMFPGQFGGIGSGFSVKMNNKHKFHLITLYTSTKTERERLSAEERVSMRHNRLLAHQAHVEAGEEPTYELQESIKGLCRSVDAFVFVVDASKGSDNVLAGKKELCAVMNELWASQHVPVVILSCVPTEDTPRMCCYDVVKTLDLQSSVRPWQVHDCVVNPRQGVVPALEWLVNCAQ